MPKPADPAPKPARAAATAIQAKAKPSKPEDKPFEVFIPESFLPALQAEIEAYGGPPAQLEFESGPMPVVGSDCWMIKGILPGQRRFWLCFTEPSITATKTIAVAEAGDVPSLLESFLIDEKRMSLALLVSRLVQRLNGQKWLGPN